MTDREDKVVSLANTLEKKGMIELSTGIVLRAKKVPNMVYADLTRKFPRPKPPRVFIKDIGREEENPDDPNYIAALDAWNSDVALSMVDVMILLGTAIESVPEDMEKPDGTQWSEDLEIIGLPIGTNQRKRYLMWVKHYAAPSDEDIALITEQVGKLSGVSEKDVADAVKFRKRDAG
jgi:hypothetical protein